MATSGTVVSNKRGVKRAAEDSLEGEQRLAKRFNLLNLDHNGRLWIPVSPPVPSPDSQHVQHTKAHRETSRRNEWSEDDYMQVEDTKDKIYIHNLDDELQSDEDVPEEDRIVFLSDVERHLSTIPKHLLTGGQPSHSQPAGNELVLYSIPTSLSVPVEQDSVRKAIIESRARARDKQQQLAHGQAGDHNMDTKEPIAVKGYVGDEDAMDIG